MGNGCETMATLVTTLSTTTQKVLERQPVVWPGSLEGVSAMRFVSQAPLHVRVVLIVLAAITAVGLVLSILGFSPVVLVSVVLGLAALAIGQRFGWATSVAAAVLFLLLGNTIVLRLLPLTGVELGVANTALLTLSAAGLWFWLVTRAKALRLPDSAALIVAASALLAPLMTGVIVVATLGLGSGMRVGWLMGTGTDVVWNTVASRFILNDNGIAPWLNPNPSPLVNGLMASWYAPGRGAAEEVLRHDVARQSELLILLFLLCSVLAGIVTARAVPARRPVMRGLAGVFGSLIPLTWYLAGFVIRFGFFNVAVAVAILLCVWLVWTDLPRHAAASIGLLLVATTILLAAWAPLAALSLGLAGVAGMVHWRTLVRLRGVAAVLFLVSGAQLVLYVLLVTLPDLTRDGAALGANGGVPEITPLDVVLAAVLIFAFAAVAAVGLGQRHELLGVVVVLVATTVGIGYLALQRRGMDTLWGYYPAKLGWLVSVLIVIVLAASLLRWLSHQQASGLNTVAVLFATLLVVGLIMAKVPPLNRDLAGVLPLIGIGLTPDSATDLARQDVLFAEADSGKKEIFARYSASADDDAFINYWLLQLNAASSDDPVRKFAYTLDSTDPEEVCAAAEAWGNGVVVVTRDAAFEQSLRDACPAGEFALRLR